MWLDAARLLLVAIGQIGEVPVSGSVTLLHDLFPGSAVAFTYWNPQIQCPDQSTSDTDTSNSTYRSNLTSATDQQGVCKLINIYMLVGCWIIPVIRQLQANFSWIQLLTACVVVLYASYFAAMVYRQSRIPVAVDSREKVYTDTGSPLVVDPEIAIASPHLSVLDIRASMSPLRTLSSDSFSHPEANIPSPLTATAMPRRDSHPQPGALGKQSPQRHVSVVPSFVDSVQIENNARRSGRLSKPLPPWCM